MRAFRIPSVLALVASLALLGCGDLGTGPSVDAPQFTPGKGQGNAVGHSHENNEGNHVGDGLAGAHSHGPTCPPNCGF